MKLISHLFYSETDAIASYYCMHISNHSHVEHCDKSTSGVKQGFPTVFLAGARSDILLSRYREDREVKHVAALELLVSLHAHKFVFLNIRGHKCLTQLLIESTPFCMFEVERKIS